MLRKNKTEATVAENRDAQRRSRARRQELIADLQSRLKAYERMGVAASIEMQRVAQVVNVQNQHLKDLLGVAVSTDDQPQSSFPSASSMVNDTMPTVMSVVSNPIPPTHDGKQPSPTVPPVQSVQHQEENEALFMFQAGEQEFHDGMHGANTVDDPAAGNSSAPTDVFSPLTDSLDTSDFIIHSRNHSEPLETSCDKAAEILVEIHNHTDPSSARLALGCCGDSSCTVKNTKVFQLMDRFE
ncbi:unnamed protein product [Fusarium equiseti]|uniref:BZIP domain-containing protein n=1 Tax=Fusarium equiseti TaxID=61235 RepID=A0A8J2IJZ8_FUSEQ|nr:unnamed protein product [Fusarium equiseti]